MKSLTFPTFISAFLLIAGAAAVSAQVPAAPVHSATDVKWGPVPPVLPAGAQIARGPTVVQVHGMGPFAITYVHSADDPRNKSK